MEEKQDDLKIEDTRPEVQFITVILSNGAQGKFLGPVLMTVADTLKQPPLKVVNVLFSQPMKFPPQGEVVDVPEQTQA